MNSRTKTLALAIVMALVAVIGFVSYKTDGFGEARVKIGIPGSEPFAWNYMTNPACLAKTKTTPQFCIQLGEPKRITTAILGDSTANALVPGVADILNARGEGLINIGMGSCPPIRGLIPTETWGLESPNCPEITEDGYRVILADKNIKTVILGMFTNDFGRLGIKNLPADASLELRMATLMSMLDLDIQALNAAGKKVILTYDTPLSPISSRDCISRPVLQWMKSHKNCEVTESQIVNRYPQITILDNHYLGRKDVCVFHQSPLLFTDGRLNFADMEGVLIRDRHHLSVHGSKKMAQLLATSNCRDSLP